MSNRRIILYSSANDQEMVVETSATTWGELLKQNPNLESFAANMSATIKEPRTKIDGPSTSLPNQDLVIYLTVDKIKAGADSPALGPKEFFREQLGKFMGNYASEYTKYKGRVTLNELAIRHGEYTRQTRG